MRLWCVEKQKLLNRTKFPLDISLLVGKPKLWFMLKAVSEVSWICNRKLAYLNFWYINNLVTREMVKGLLLLKFDNDTLCLTCNCGKKTKVNNSLILNSLIAEPLELLHIDLCGPLTVASLHHKKYMLIIVDEYTLFTWIFFLRMESEKPQNLINFIKEIKLQIKLCIRKYEATIEWSSKIDF